MDIGTKIKETIDFNENLISKINSKFEFALGETQEKGLRVRNTSQIRMNLAADINGCSINIPIGEVIKELKNPTGKLREDLQDEVIERVVN